MRSHSRRRSPDGSFHGMPLSCTRRPGACPTTSTRAVGHARSTGFGASGRCASHIRQARTSASSSLKSGVLTCVSKLALADEPAIAEIKPLSKGTSAELERIIEIFSEGDAEQAKAIEAETNHDVK